MPVYSTQGLGILESLCPNKKGATGDSYVYGRQAILLSSWTVIFIRQIGLEDSYVAFIFICMVAVIIILW
jgi:hypothetical protein